MQQLQEDHKEEQLKLKDEFALQEILTPEMYE